MAIAMKEGLQGWLQRVRTTEEYSDVVVRVNGHDFRLHMLPLMNASAFFRTRLPFNAASDAAHLPKLVTIHDLPGGVEGFAICVDMCYLLNPELSMLNVAFVYAAAEFLAMEEVAETAKHFMHTNIFSHWRSCTNFLRNYTPTGSPTTDDYVASHCQAVIVTACVKLFTEIKHLAAASSFEMISGPSQKDSGSGALTELLVQVGSLPDVYVGEIVTMLVDRDLNLSLKCRQGRNVRRWLENLLEDECPNETARCWILLCLSRMLLKNVPAKRPWLELCSQYWCSLLEQIGLLLPLLDNPLQAKLLEVKATLEEKIGESLDEMDEYLRDYKFGATTLLSLVQHFVTTRQQISQQSLREIANDVDQFLWFYAEEQSISTDTFLKLVKAFPPSARSSHDTIYGAMEKLLSSSHLPNCPPAPAEEQRALRALVDHSKLSPSMALRNSNHLGTVLHRHSQELARVDDDDKITDGRHLRHIMQKVIDASLQLLEENSQRSREIVALQKQYAELLDCRARRLDVVEDILRRKSRSLCHISISSETTEGSDLSNSTNSSSITVLGYNLGARRLGEIFRDGTPDCSAPSPC